MSLKFISIVISDISDLSELFPFSLLLLYSRKSDVRYKILIVYFSCTSLLKIYALVTSKFHINNMHAYHILAIIELLFVYSFYVHILNKKNIYFFLGLMGLISITIVDTIIHRKFNEFNNVAWGLNASTIIIFGIMYFYKIYQQADNIKIEGQPLFFINAGLLIYASGSFFTYLFGWKILSKDAVDLFHNAWLIQSISNFIKNIVISYGIWLMRVK